MVRIASSLSLEARFTEISDTDLDRVVEDIKRYHPNDGERLLTGHLTQRGITVPRARLKPPFIALIPSILN